MINHPVLDPRAANALNKLDINYLILITNLENLTLVNNYMLLTIQF